MSNGLILWVTGVLLIAPDLGKHTRLALAFICVAMSIFTTLHTAR